jgi:putative transposase
MTSDIIHASRFNIPGHAHELSFSCYQRRPLLNCDYAKSLLVDAVNFAAVKHHFDIWAYVIMPEHIHIMLFPYAESYSISNILKGIKQPLSQSYIYWCQSNHPEYLESMRTGLDKPFYRFWQKGGGYDRNYWNEKEICDQIDYEHMNPVKRGLVEKPEDWEWSSAGFWMYGNESKIKIEKRYMRF